MDREIIITTGARLHFGLLTNHPQTGRNFGGAGLMVNAPGFQIAAKRAATDEFIGDEYDRNRAAQIVRTFREGAPSDRPGISARIEIRRQIPPHAGLGAGTQLAMAVGQALALLGDERSFDAVDIAKRVGRGQRSALGLHGFARGGFLVDGGKTNSSGIAPLVARADFPSEWRFVLIKPGDASGLSGADENAAFARLPPVPRSTTEHLCALIVMQLLPAVIEADFATCGEALFEFGQTVGEYFEPAQQGVYAHSEMAALVKQLRKADCRGVGQSSWGPTIFALCPDAQHADELAQDLQQHARWSECKIHVAAPMNTGAAIEVGS